jgi:DDE family transposase/transposase-like protein DUF772
MEFERWNPRREPSKQEQFLLKRLNKTRKLFRFLREHRHELFDDGFQAELESMYRRTGAGAKPLPPAMMAMAVLLQGYLGVSDAEAVELTVVDLRWQMVLDRLGAEEPAFSQGVLRDFRERLIRTEMDRRLLERTVELARTTQGFDWKKLPKTLRVGMDSSPLEGAGRVEDTINLLGHAARKVVECVAHLIEWTPAQVCQAAGIPLLLASSVKTGLDVEWSDPEQKAGAVRTLTKQLEALDAWIKRRLPEEMKQPPLKEPLAVLQQIIDQDLEPDPGGGSRVRRGVAEDRRVSIEDGEMRHGRKSKSKRFNGYKRHLAADLDTDLILSCAITPANRPEEEAASELRADIERQSLTIDELFIDRGYINSPVVNDTLGIGGDVVCKPWVARNANGKAFTKAAFRLNMREMTITCPAGEVEKIRPGMVVEFNPDACAQCPLRAQCTMAAQGSGRTVSIAADEKLQQRLRKQIATSAGRKRLRKRVGIEHRLAHISQRQGRRARYRGVRRNLFDLRRAAALQNLETIQRKMAA